MNARLLSLALAILPVQSAAADAADLACNGLVPPGLSLVCSAFEPNWAVEFRCDGELTSNFTDAFSGNVTVTPGSVAVRSDGPWYIETSHPVTGTIAFSPSGCRDESDRVYDFVFMPTGAPGLSAPFRPFCCRVE